MRLILVLPCFTPKALEWAATSPLLNFAASSAGLGCWPQTCLLGVTGCCLPNPALPGCGLFCHAVSFHANDPL